MSRSEEVDSRMQHFYNDGKVFESRAEAYHHAGAYLDDVIRQNQNTLVYALKNNILTAVERHGIRSLLIRAYETKFIYRAEYEYYLCDETLDSFIELIKAFDTADDCDRRELAEKIVPFLLSVHRNIYWGYVVSKLSLESFKPFCELCLKTDLRCLIVECPWGFDDPVPLAIAILHRFLPDFDENCENGQELFSYLLEKHKLDLNIIHNNYSFFYPIVFHSDDRGDDTYCPKHEKFLQWMFDNGLSSQNFRQILAWDYLLTDELMVRLYSSGEFSRMLAINIYKRRDYLTPPAENDIQEFCQEFNIV